MLPTLNLGSTPLVIGVLGLPAFLHGISAYAVKKKYQKSALFHPLLVLCLLRGTCSCLNLH
jgi:hypothetical protein